MSPSKGPKTARGIWNKMMAGDGRKNPAKQFAESLWGKPSKGKKKGKK